MAVAAHSDDDLPLSLWLPRPSARIALGLGGKRALRLMPDNGGMDEVEQEWDPEELLLAKAWDWILDQDIHTRVRLPLDVADAILASARERRANRAEGALLEPGGAPALVGTLAMRIEATGIREVTGVVVDLDPFMLGMVFLLKAEPEDDGGSE